MSEGSKNNSGQNTDTTVNPVKRPNPVLRLDHNIPQNKEVAENAPETAAPDAQKSPDSGAATGGSSVPDSNEKKPVPTLRLNPNIRINNKIITPQNASSDTGSKKGPVIRLNTRIVKPKDVETQEAEIPANNDKHNNEPAKEKQSVKKTAETNKPAEERPDDTVKTETDTDNKKDSETKTDENKTNNDVPRIRKGPRLNTRGIKLKGIENNDAEKGTGESGNTAPDKEENSNVISDEDDDKEVTSQKEPDDDGVEEDDGEEGDNNEDDDDEDDDYEDEDDDDEENILGKILTSFRKGFISFIEILINFRRSITPEVMIAWLLVIIGTVVYASLTFNNNVWLDEAFTASLIDTDMAGVLQRSMADTLPPLYNIILKLSTDIFGYTITVMKLTSAVPIVLTMILGATVVRKRFGALVSYIFILAVIVMPNMMFYGVEIRMYSLGFLFATASGIFAYEVLVEPRIKNWILFILSSVLAGYSHHFAFVAVGFVYLCLLIYAILRHMNFKDDDAEDNNKYDDSARENESDDDYNDRVYNNDDEDYYDRNDEYDSEEADDPEDDADDDEDVDEEEDDEADDEDDEEDDEDDEDTDDDDSLDGEKKEKKKYPVNLINFAICLAVTIILYIPCLVVTIKQLHSVGEYFSMPDVTFKVFIKYCRYPFTVGFTPFSILLFVTCIALFIRLCIRRDKTIKDWFMMCCFMLYYGVLLFGTFVSKMMSANIFVDRYLFFSLGLIWLFFSVEAASLKKPLVYAVIALELLTGVYSYTQAYTSEYAPDADETIKWLADNVKDGDSLYTLEDYEELAWCLTFYRKGLINYESLNEAVSAAGDGNVWIAVMDGYESETATELPIGNLGYAAYINELENKGYSMEYVGVLRFDRYRLKMYKLIINNNE
ncbi:MAG: glycosyltransferase family 39 protein [Lachnospiraceae bacterium]|nr:glycosyltransferase family 39 protein [Lachnospiraceae bacterium]